MKGIDALLKRHATLNFNRTLQDWNILTALIWPCRTRTGRPSSFSSSIWITTGVAAVRRFITIPTTVKLLTAATIPAGGTSRRGFGAVFCFHHAKKKPALCRICSQFFKIFVTNFCEHVFCWRLLIGRQQHGVQVVTRIAKNLDRCRADVDFTATLMPQHELQRRLATCEVLKPMHSTWVIQVMAVLAS